MTHRYVFLALTLLACGHIEAIPYSDDELFWTHISLTVIFLTRMLSLFSVVVLYCWHWAKYMMMMMIITVTSCILTIFSFIFTTICILWRLALCHAFFTIKWWWWWWYAVHSFYSVLFLSVVILLLQEFKYTLCQSVCYVLVNAYFI